MPGNHVALARALRAERSRLGLRSDKEFGKAVGVHYQTLQNWMYGKTTPRAHELSKFARAVDKPADYFMAIYEDREPEAQPLHEAVAELTVAVRALVDELREEHGQGEARGKAAASALRPSEDNGSHATPPAPRGTRE